MFKLFTAGLLLVVGLASGLWLGFNPKMHQQIVQDWNRASVSVAHVGLGTSAKPSALQPIAPTSKPSSQTQFNVSATWKQISVAFEGFWRSIQRLFLNTSARVGRVR